MEKIISDTREFQILNDDATLCNISTIQIYFNTMYQREITLEERIKMCLKLAHVEELVDYQRYTRLEICSFFSSIVDTTNTLYYSVVKYLSPLWNSLTENQVSVKDSFVSPKQNIP